MTRSNNYVFLLLGAVFVTSCIRSNKISFEIDEQAIKSCNQKGLENIFIANVATSDMYRLVFRDTLNAQSPRSIFLNSLSDLYSVYQGSTSKEISYKAFTLSASSQYTIQRVQGDASPYTIRIWTDENKKVIKSTHEICD